MQTSSARRPTSTLVALTLSFISSIFIGSAHAQNAPKITFAPKVIHEIGTFDINGSDFGTTPGKIHIYFPTSAVQLPNGVSTHELILSPQPSDWSPTHIHSDEIVLTYPIGAADNQQLDITVSIDNGKVTSNVWKQTQFTGAPMIRGGSNNITPNQLFMLTGWNFGHAGTLNVHFQNPPHDLNVNIPSPSTTFWKRFAIILKLPPVTGFIGQPADITFTRNDGLGSNQWPVTFVPTMALAKVPSSDIAAVTCGNKGEFNFCSGAGDISSSHWCADAPLGPAFLPTGSNFGGNHIGCPGIGSTNGTDTFSVAVKNGWILDQIDFTPATQYDPCCQSSGSVYPNDIAPVVMSNYPNPYTFNVPWHIQPGGGWVNYGGNFIVDGPKGVPY
jgi:hypothetical protein